MIKEEDVDSDDQEVNSEDDDLETMQYKSGNKRQNIEYNPMIGSSSRSLFSTSKTDIGLQCGILDGTDKKDNLPRKQAVVFKSEFPPKACTRLAIGFYF